MSNVFTSHDAILELNRLCERINGLDGELRECATTLALRDHEYKRAYARAYVAAEGPVKERECRADIATENEYLALKVAEAQHQVTRDAMFSVRAQLTALQSIANALRAELELGGRR